MKESSPPCRIIFNAFSGEDGGSVKKVTELAGNILGDFGNRFQQPLQPFYGVLDSFDKEFQVARDPQSITSETTPSRLYEIASNRFMARGSAAVQYAFSEAGELAPQPVRDFFKVIIPQTKLEMPKALNMLDTTAPVRGGEFFNAIAGVRITPKVNEVEKVSEDEGHHPEISFGWGYAEIRITTHAIKGLSENDFILAAKIDKINV